MKKLVFSDDSSDENQAVETLQNRFGQNGKGEAFFLNFFRSGSFDFFKRWQSYFQANFNHHQFSLDLVRFFRICENTMIANNFGLL